MKMLNKYFCAAALLLLASCKHETAPKPLSHGTADFSTYIAVGNSLTAGYSNGGLTLASQLVSYPNIVAGQMETVGGGAFAQPLFSASQANGSGYLELDGFNADGVSTTQMVTTDLAVRGTISIAGYGNVTLYTKYTGAINNFGVPNIKLRDITNPNYGNINGFFERLLPGNAPNNTTTYLNFITQKPFTFFSNWLGNNDAFAYALAGGSSDTLTDKTTFSLLYNQLITKLTASGQKGVVATIPDVTIIPYFNTITVSSILTVLKRANPSVSGIYINALNSESISGTYHARLATTQDLITLTFNPAKIGQMVATSNGQQPYGLSPYAPIENQYVLDANEVLLIKDYINSYNQTIKVAAAAKGLALYDAYAFFNQITYEGLLINGETLDSDYISGGIFSLDGVHLTARGYAANANQIINAINSTYGSTIPTVDVLSYKGLN